MVPLLVALFVIIVILASSLRKRHVNKRFNRSVFEQIRAEPESELPKGYYLSQGHLWLSLAPSENLKIGIDELIQRFFGKIDNIHLKQTGNKILRGKPLAILNKGDTEIFLLSPITGQIIKANTKLEKQPEIVTESPYEAGWFYIMKPLDLAEDLLNLIEYENALNWLADEWNRLKDFVLRNLSQPTLDNIILSDGGLLIDGLANHLDPKVLIQFEKQFMLIPSKYNLNV